MLTQEDEDRYTAALERGGFFGPDSWYMNAPANADFADRAKAKCLSAQLLDLFPAA